MRNEDAEPRVDELAQQSLEHALEAEWEVTMGPVEVEGHVCPSHSQTRGKTTPPRFLTKRTFNFLF